MKRSRVRRIPVEVVVTLRALGMTDEEIVAEIKRRVAKNPPNKRVEPTPESEASGSVLEIK